MLLQDVSSSNQDIIQVEDIIEKFKENTPEEFTNSITNDINSKNKECPICFETTVENVLLPCLHVLCSACMHEIIGRETELPGDNLEWYSLI